MRLIYNPRRWPRVAARLRADVAYRGRDWQGETEDFGPGGCLLLSPQPLDPETWVRLTLHSERVAAPLAVMGRVAWATQMERCRAGIAFAEEPVEGRLGPAAWFERLVQATPGMVRLMQHVPDRLPVDTPLYLLPPPRFIVDFTSQELRAVAAVGEGATVEDVLARTEREKRHEGRIVFALLARRVLTLSPQDACPPSAWRPLLEQAGVAPDPEIEHQEPEEVVRLEELSAAPQEAAPSAGILPQWLSPASPGWSEQPDPPGAVPPPYDAGSESGAPPRAATPTPPVATRAAPPVPGAAPPAPAGHAPGGAGSSGSSAAGTGPPASPPVLERSGPGGRKPAGRSAQAQQLFDQALATAEHGDVRDAIKLLRQALALSPRDPEIASAIGRLAFKDRKLPET